jgi:DNA-directed RNA polymerase alpha subunit
MVNRNKRIDEVDFGKTSVKLRNIFYQNKIFTIGDLGGKSAEDLLKMYNFGKYSLVCVKQTLENMGIRDLFASSGNADDHVSNTYKSERAKRPCAREDKPTCHI